MICRFISLLLVCRLAASQPCDVCLGPSFCGSLNDVNCVDNPACTCQGGVGDTPIPTVIGCLTDTECSCPGGGCTCDVGSGLCLCPDGTGCNGLDCSTCPGVCTENAQCTCAATDCRCEQSSCRCNVDNSLCPGNDCSACPDFPDDCVENDECSPCPAGGCTCSADNGCLCADGADCPSLNDCSACDAADVLTIDGIRVEFHRFDFDRGLAASWDYTVERIGDYIITDCEFDENANLTRVAFECDVDWIWEIGNLRGEVGDVGLLDYIRLLTGGGSGSVTNQDAGGATAGRSSAGDVHKPIVGGGNIGQNGDDDDDDDGGDDGGDVGAQNDSPAPPSPPTPPASPAPPTIILPDFFDVEIWTEIDFYVQTPAGRWMGTAILWESLRFDLVERVEAVANNPDVIFDAEGSSSSVLTEICAPEENILLLAKGNDLGAVSDYSTSSEDDDRMMCLEVNSVDAGLANKRGFTNHAGGSTTWPATGFGTIDPNPPSISPATPPSPVPPPTPASPGAKDGNMAADPGDKNNQEAKPIFMF